MVSAHLPSGREEGEEAKTGMINHHDHFGLRRMTSKLGRYTPFLQYRVRNHASIQSAGRRREPRKDGYHIFSHLR